MAEQGPIRVLSSKLSKKDILFLLYRKKEIGLKLFSCQIRLRYNKIWGSVNLTNIICFQVETKF